MIKHYNDNRMTHLLHKTFFLDWVIPILLLAIIAPWASAIDLTLANYFYTPASGQFSTHPFFTFFYEWGLLPGQIIGIAALLVLVGSYFKPELKHCRYPALVIGLTIAIGAGLFTQVIFKEYWKRPRPKQVEQFGGTEPFRAFNQPNFSAKGNFKSFPSGHCTMGFCFFALAILGRRLRNRKLLIWGLIISFSLGFCLAMARIAQGGHFFSDTVASACLMWITAATCDWFLWQRYAVKDLNA